MPHVRSFVPLTLAVGLAIATPARAQYVEQALRDCQQSPDLATSERGCTIVIDSGRAVGDNLAQAYSTRSDKRALMRDRRGALADISEAIAIKPGVAPWLYSRGQLHAGLGDHDRAIQDFDRAIALGGFYRGPSYYQRGISYYALGVHRAVIADMTELLRLEPDPAHPANRWALNLRASSHLQLGNVAAALADCDTAIRTAPEVPELREMRGIVHLRARRFDPALADFTAVLARAPERPAAVFGRGLARIGKGQTAAGKADLEQARRLRPDVETGFRRHGVAIP